MNSLKFNHSGNLSLPFRIFTVSIFIIALVPSLIQDGMFSDGLQYAAISKNLSNGLGTFWFPYLSENWSTYGSEYFLEHPPLVYAIQSIFFWILGDGMYTERIYCLITAAISAILIAEIWKLVSKNDPEINKMSWLPVLFWIITPIVFRSFQMNVQENTMGIFILSSVYFSLKGIKSPGYSYLYLIIAGIFIFLASLCKGVPGLFPVVTIGAFWLAGRRIKFKRMLIYSVILTAVPAVLYSLVLLNDNAYASLSFYITERLFERVQHAPVANSHLDILLRLLIDLLPIIFISPVIYFAGRKRLIPGETSDYKKDAIFFILMGFAGSVPLALTLVQRDFYLSPSLPFYAIGFALFTAPFLNAALKRIFKKSAAVVILWTMSIALLFGGLIYSGMMIGRSERDQNILNDMYLIGNATEGESRIAFSAHQNYNWSFELYLIRYFDVGLDYSNRNYTYLIGLKSDEVMYQDSFELIPLPTRTYSLYRKTN